MDNNIIVQKAARMSEKLFSASFANYKWFPEVDLMALIMTAEWAQYKKNGVSQDFGYSSGSANLFGRYFITRDFGGIAAEVLLDELPKEEMVEIQIAIYPSPEKSLPYKGYRNNYWLECQTTFKKINEFAIASVRSCMFRPILYLEWVQAYELEMPRGYVELRTNKERELVTLIESEGLKISVQEAIRMGFKKARTIL